MKNKDSEKVLTINENSYQKQPSIGALMESCSENMQQIYRKISMPKCDFNKVVLNTNKEYL